MNTETLLSQAVKGALAFGAAGGLVGGGAALAQQAPAPATTTQLSKIVVTGSHIPRTAIATAQPVTTINRAEIEATGLTTVGELLKQLPQTSPSIGLQTTNNVGRSAGATYINIHGLGSQRLLVLLNGQRLAPGITGAVDFSVIPLGVVDHIEVLLDGASPVYGTKAIAGVINIVTIKNYNGAQVSAYMGIYDATNDGGGWDGKRNQYNFLIGTTGDRSAVLLGAGYRQLDPIWAGNRTISKEPYYGWKGTLLGSSNLPQGRYGFLMPFPSSAPYFTPTITQNCGLTSSTAFVSCSLAGPWSATQSPHAFTNFDRYNFQPDNQLRLGQELWNVYTQGHYDLTSSITFNTSVLYSHRIAYATGAAAPLGIGASGFLPNNGLNIGIAGSNPYNPFPGVDLIPYSPSAANTTNPSHANYVAWCQKYGSGANGGCTTTHFFLMSASNRDIAHGKRDQKNIGDTFRFSGSFTGYFMMFSNQWTWNAGYFYENQNFKRLTQNLYNDARLAQALGDISNCLPASCVPYNFFGGSHHGPHADAQANYVQYTGVFSHAIQMRDYSASLAGNFWNSWYAGPWGVAVGYEYHGFYGQFTPDSLVQESISSTNGTLPSDGRVGANAQYFELQIPLGLGVPGFEKFSIDLANRWAQFTTHGHGAVSTGGPAQPQAGGANYAVSVGHVGVKWTPVEPLLLRASWTQGFRVPSITEMFSGGQQSYSAVTDPCANPIPAQYCPPVPPNPPASQPDGQILTTFGGNSALQPERSVSRSIGFVYSPKWAPGLDINADYYKVEIFNTIAAVGPQSILNQCYLHNDPSYCALITRVGGVIKNINAVTQNLGSLRTNGWDVGIHYQFPATAIGQFSADLTANFVKFFYSCSTSGSCTNFAGSAGTPKQKYNFSVNWSYGPWAAVYRMHVIGDMWETCSATFIFGADAGGTGALTHLLYNSLTQIGYARNVSHCSDPNKYIGGQHVGQNHLGTVIYSDIQASYTVNSWDTTFTLGVNNLFDKKPPIAQATYNPAYYIGLYRVPGRYFYGRISVRF